MSSSHLGAKMESLRVQEQLLRAACQQHPLPMSLRKFCPVST